MINKPGLNIVKICVQGAHFVTEDEAKRIFQGVDRDNDDKFTLEDLKKEANKYVAIETGVP